MAHGLGLSQDCHLEPFVDAFLRAGFAAFTFDYATFGASDGFPRHQTKPRNHVRDLEAAATMLRDQADDLGIDTSRMALWGTSLGGGHVLTAASRDPSFAAVVALVPHVSSAVETILTSTLVHDPLNTTVALLKFAAGVVKFVISGAVFGKPTYIPLHGVPGSFSMMQNEGDDAGYQSLVVPAGGQFGWKNAATMGGALSVLSYRPLNQVTSIKSPTLFLLAEKDTLCPPQSAIIAKDRMANA